MCESVFSHLWGTHMYTFKNTHLWQTLSTEKSVFHRCVKVRFHTYESHTRMKDTFENTHLWQSLDRGMTLCKSENTHSFSHKATDRIALEIVLQHIATHCNALQHNATHCNTLQHTITQRNTLQHTATHYNSHTNKHMSGEIRPIEESFIYEEQIRGLSGKRPWIS